MSSKRLIQVCLILILMVASLATTSSAQASSYCGGTYVVQRGDWLAKIARRCGVTLTALRSWNPWAGNVIYPGQVLSIPGGYYDGYDGGGYYDGYDDGGYDDGYYYCGPSWDGYGSYWYVCRGDTLGGIARYYGVNWRYLQQVNGIPNANRIYPGQIIRP